MSTSAALECNAREVGREVWREGHGFRATHSFWRRVEISMPLRNGRALPGRGAHCVLFTVISMGQCLCADRGGGRSPPHMHTCLCAVVAGEALFFGSGG